MLAEAADALHAAWKAKEAVDQAADVIHSQFFQCRLVAECAGAVADELHINLRLNATPSSTAAGVAACSSGSNGSTYAPYMPVSIKAHNPLGEVFVYSGGEVGRCCVCVLFASAQHHYTYTYLWQAVINCL